MRGRGCRCSAALRLPPVDARTRRPHSTLPLPPLPPPPSRVPPRSHTSSHTSPHTLHTCSAPFFASKKQRGASFFSPPPGPGARSPHSCILARPPLLSAHPPSAHGAARPHTPPLTSFSSSSQLVSLAMLVLFECACASEVVGREQSGRRCSWAQRGPHRASSHGCSPCLALLYRLRNAGVRWCGKCSLLAVCALALRWGEKRPHCGIAAPERGPCGVWARHRHAVSLASIAPLAGLFALASSSPSIHAWPHSRPAWRPGIQERLAAEPLGAARVQAAAAAARLLQARRRGDALQRVPTLLACLRALHDRRARSKLQPHRTPPAPAPVRFAGAPSGFGAPAWRAQPPISRSCSRPSLEVSSSLSVARPAFPPASAAASAAHTPHSLPPSHRTAG